MNTRTRLMPKFAALALTVAAATTANAEFTMNWFTIDCGGGVSTGTSAANVTYAITSVIGQPDAGPRVAGGGITFDGGFLPTGIAVPPACPTDLNHDGITNTADLVQFLAAFGLSGPLPADFNNDGTVNTADLVQFLSGFGNACP